MSNCPVWIIIPIYNQSALVEQCVESVLTANVETEYKVCLIDDASTEPEISALLDRFEGDARFECIRNSENLGFTRTANIGIRQAGRSNPLLLNSDTIVYDHWLDELVGILGSEPKVSSVTPMSNQWGSHLTCYPDAKMSDVSLIDVPDENIARAAYDACGGVGTAIHAGVGFCLLLNRQCIDEVGQLDEINFPRGYGEEADFCYRASYLGWRNLAAAGCFVTHLHGKSFGSEKALLMETMISNFRSLHPSQPALDLSFQERDPMRHVRRRIDLGRLKQDLSGSSELLFLASNQEQPSGAPFLSAENISSKGVELRMISATTVYPNIGTYSLPIDAALLANDMKIVGIKRLVIDCDTQGLIDLRNLIAVGSELEVRTKEKGNRQ